MSRPMMMVVVEIVTLEPPASEFVDGSGMFGKLAQLSAVHRCNCSLRALDVDAHTIRYLSHLLAFEQPPDRSTVGIGALHVGCHRAIERRLIHHRGLLSTHCDWQHQPSGEKDNEDVPRDLHGRPP